MCKLYSETFFFLQILLFRRFFECDMLQNAIELIYFVLQSSQSCLMGFKEDLVKCRHDEHRHADTKAVT